MQDAPVEQSPRSGAAPRSEVPRGGLRSAAQRLLACGSLVNSGFATSSVFVSLFFYVTSGSIDRMALYDVGRYTGLIVMSGIVVRLAPAASPRRLFRVGLTLTAAFYLLLIALGTRVDELALPLGLFSGAAAGTYWFGSNTLVYDVLQPDERGNYYGFSFAILSVLNVVMPLLSGAIISRIGGESGYVAVFAIALASFTCAWWLARRLRGAGGVGGVSIRYALVFPLLRAGWGRMWIAVVLRGMKQAAGGIGLIVLVAAATHSSEAQGLFAAVASFAGVTTSVVAGRVAPAHRARAMWIGAGGFVVATALLFVRVDLAMLLVYGFVSGFVYPGLMVPLSTVVLESIDADPLAAEYRGGYILSREIAANVGRLLAIGLLVALLALAPPIASVLAMLATAAVLQLVVARLGATAEEHLHRGSLLAPTRP